MNKPFVGLLGEKIKLLQGEIAGKDMVIKQLESRLAGLTSYVDEAAGRLSKEGCICHGNWRAIVKESEPLIGKWFVDDKGARWNFFGPVHGGDDYYYGMIGEGGKLALLSCVGSIEGFGYKLESA